MPNTMAILDFIKSAIRPEYIKGSEIKFKQNISYYSIIVTSKKTAYRDSDTSDLLFARIKIGKKGSYISFSSKYSNLFDSAKIPYTISKSDSKFIRIDLDVFNSLNNRKELLSPILNQIFIDLFSFPAFGCCSNYIKCSDERHCIHPDPAYATACQYRKNLESGHIFYGKNKNIQ